MPNDARIGLLCGVGLVIAVAVVFFRRDVQLADLPASPAAFGRQSDGGLPNPVQRPQVIARVAVMTPDKAPVAELPSQPADVESKTLFHSAVRHDGPPPIGLIPNQDAAPVALTLPGSH